MLQIEEKTLKVKALQDMIGPAVKLIEDAREKIKTWLASRTEHHAEIDGTVKALLEVRLEKTTVETVTDEVAVGAEFSELIRRGRYTQAEIHGLLQSGILAVAKPDALAGVVGLKIRGYVAPTKTVTTVVTAGDPLKSPLKINVLDKGRYEGLKDRIRCAIDLEAAVRSVLENELPPAPVPRGQTALQRRA